jgi:glycerophosphoryl diester phosphodiesterase
MSYRPLAIAHRGDPVAERENTLAAFAAAVDAGADMVELDLRRSRDGAIVVLHDPTLARLWRVDRPVAELDLAEIADLGRRATRIPTLAQVLAAVDIPLMIDFTGEEVVAGAIEAVRQAGAMERSLFVSGNVRALRAVRAHAPEARIGLTWVKEELPWPALTEELGVEYWNPNFGRVSPESVAAMHERGLKVSTWTVDTKHDMARVADAGVDAIVSNCIRRLRRFLS